MKPTWIKKVVAVEDVLSGGHILIRSTTDYFHPLFGTCSKLLFIHNKNWRPLTAHSLTRWTIEVNVSSSQLNSFPELSPCPSKRNPVHPTQPTTPSSATEVSPQLVKEK